MEISNLIPHIEALIFASDRPLTAMDITELVNNALGFMDDKITMEQIQTSIDGIVEKYQSEFYAFEMRESGGGWQFLTKKEYHKTVAQLNGEKFLKRLSTAALETLAIIAYRQPITKADIESIRGVNSDYSIQKLLEKELIVITGRNEEMPGKPLVYATSKTFMDYFGINSPADLPKLKEIYDEAMVNPTSIHERKIDSENIEEQNITEDTEVPEKSILVVSENGQLLEDTKGISEPGQEHNVPDADEDNESDDGETNSDQQES
jgi:segregation and condensation protein B